MQEKTKNFKFKTSHWVSRTIFRKGWQNHFPFVQGQFLETKCFLQKTYTMKFLTFSSKKLPTLRKKPHSVDEIAFDEHCETMWKKIIFPKKTVCTPICYRLPAGILRQFSRGCFLHIQGYTSGRKCRPKKKTINFDFELWYKNLRTFSETFPQGYLYCILVVQRHLLGKNVSKVFLIIIIFWVCAEIFRQVVRTTIH